MIDPSYLAVLRLIHFRLDGHVANWVLTGSLGLALQGVQTAVNDIDLQTDRDGAYAIERCFVAERRRPVRFSETAHIRSHFGALAIDGIEVEIMGDLQKRLDDGTWEPPPDLHRYRHWIEVEGIQIPVFSLAYEARAYRRLGRPRKAELIRRAMEG